MYPHGDFLHLKYKITDIYLMIDLQKLFFNKEFFMDNICYTVISGSYEKLNTHNDFKRLEIYMFHRPKHSKQYMGNSPHTRRVKLFITSQTPTLSQNTTPSFSTRTRMVRVCGCKHHNPRGYVGVGT